MGEKESAGQPKAEGRPALQQAARDGFGRLVALAVTTGGWLDVEHFNFEKVQMPEGLFLNK